MKTWACHAIWLLISVVFSIRSAAAVLYVDANSLDPNPPYATWNTAAADIQSAIDASSAGDLILVTNGVYQTGGEVVYGLLTSRVVINKAVTVQSVNGPAFTAIQGYQIPGTINGDDAVRCVYLTNNAVLIGFTLTNGATRGLSAGSTNIQEESGGGAWCGSTNEVISNCVVTCNSCYSYGAGIYSGTVNGCQIINNTNGYNSFADGAGIAYGNVFDSTISNNCAHVEGGGAYACSLSNCLINANLNGGAAYCTLNYSTIENNTNFQNGGGAVESVLNNCLVCNNSSPNGGGVADCEINYSTLSNNFASVYGGGGYYDVYYTNAPGRNNTIVGNTAVLHGGGFYVLFQAAKADSATLNNWNFISNSAVSDGGGLYLESASTITNCSFYGNSSKGNGGGGCNANVPVLIPSKSSSSAGETPEV